MSTQGPVGPTSALTVKPERLASANELEFCDLFVWRWGGHRFSSSEKKSFDLFAKRGGPLLFFVVKSTLLAILWSEARPWQRSFGAF